MRQFCSKPVKKWKGAVGIIKEISCIFEYNPSRYNFPLKRACNLQSTGKQYVLKFKRYEID